MARTFCAKSIRFRVCTRLYDAQAIVKIQSTFSVPRRRTLRNQRNGVQPAKAFFDALPLLLAEHSPLSRVVRLWNGLTASLSKVCATSSVAQMFRHSRTKSAVSKRLVAAHRHAPPLPGMY